MGTVSDFSGHRNVYLAIFLQLLGVAMALLITLKGGEAWAAGMEEQITMWYDKPVKVTMHIGAILGHGRAYTVTPLAKESKKVPKAKKSRKSRKSSKSKLNRRRRSKVARPNGTGKRTDRKVRSPKKDL